MMATPAAIPGAPCTNWKAAFAGDKVQVTVNKHFAEPYTLVEHGDEVAIVPRPE